MPRNRREPINVPQSGKEEELSDKRGTTHKDQSRHLKNLSQRTEFTPSDSYWALMSTETTVQSSIVMDGGKDQSKVVKAFISNEWTLQTRIV